MIIRNYIQELVNRMNEERNFIQVLYGPRQAGKTTMILQLRERLSYETMYIAADDVPEADKVWIKTAWDESRRWKNYIKNSLVETSISKDILMPTKVEKPAFIEMNVVARWIS